METSSIKLPTTRFTTQRAIEGWLVVDRDGRPISDLTSSNEALRLAEKLNLAAYGGRDALHRALGAT